MGEHGAVWCVAVRRHTRQQAALEPAAMLVAALKVQVSWQAEGLSF